MTLVEFLLARIAEDELHVSGLGVRDRIAADHPDGCWLDLGGRLCVRPRGHLSDAPRVLAECEAKRRIVARKPPLRARDDVRDVHWDVLALLALPYADHPDYDQAWRP